MISESKAIEDYIDYHMEREFVENLTIPEQVLYKSQLKDTISFSSFLLNIRWQEFLNEIKNHGWLESRYKMKEFIEKLIGRLEEHSFSLFIEWEKGKYLRKDKAIQIVNELAEEYKGGWIPCETEVPIKNGKYIVMIKDAIYPTTLTYSVGEWHDDDANYYNVIAWQPLPEPYKEK